MTRHAPASAVAGSSAAVQPASQATLIVVCLATLMLLVNVSSPIVALPAIAEDLDASFTELQWVLAAYALTLAAFVLLGGSLADRLGRRRTLAAGLACTPQRRPSASRRRRR